MEKQAAAVIVGRKGSKGLPGKNVREFLGKPLVEWTIIQAKNSKLISKIIVTSDDPDILQIAHRHNVSAVQRPLEFSGDTSPIGEAILHAIGTLMPDADPGLTVVLLEPTSPLRPKGFLDQSLELFWSSNADSAVSVGMSTSQHPSFSATISDDGLLSKYDGGEMKYLRRQDIPDVFFLDGSFYATRLAALRNSNQMYSGSTFAVPVKKWQEIEIDDLDDFLMAECLGAAHFNEL